MIWRPRTTKNPPPQVPSEERLATMFGWQGMLMEAAMDWTAFEYSQRGMMAPNYRPYDEFQYWYQL